MKSSIRILFPLIIVATIFSSTLCHSEITSPIKSQAAETTTATTSDIRYTFIKECNESVENDNAAYSQLDCPDLGEYKVSITRQDPQYFNIILKKGNQETSSDFTAVSNEKPIEAGKAIEWHIQNNTPTHMIFRLSWGSDEQPFKMREYLLVNLVTSTDICVLATIDIKNNRNANEKARGLILKEFKDTRTCPEKIQIF